VSEPSAWSSQESVITGTENIVYVERASLSLAVAVSDRDADLASVALTAGRIA
jgi:hypothetical protein